MKLKLNQFSHETIISECVVVISSLDTFCPITEAIFKARQMQHSTTYNENVTTGYLLFCTLDIVWLKALWIISIWQFFLVFLCVYIIVIVRARGFFVDPPI